MVGSRHHMVVHPTAASYRAGLRCEGQAASGPWCRRNRYGRNCPPGNCCRLSLRLTNSRSATFRQTSDVTLRVTSFFVVRSTPQNALMTLAGQGCVGCQNRFRRGSREASPRPKPRRVGLAGTAYPISIDVYSCSSVVSNSQQQKQITNHKRLLTRYSSRNAAQVELCPPRKTRTRFVSFE